MESATTADIIFPEMRHEVIEALRSLSDPLHQRARWGRVEQGVSYYDDLTLNVHTLYDDCQVLPSPDSAVPDVLHDTEVPAFRALDAALGPMIRELGDRPDEEYLADPRWDKVIRAASSALAAMRACDHGQSP
jgi:hypothetical protein